jgi:hypothetical protein
MNEGETQKATDYRKMTSASDVKLFISPLSDGTSREIDAAFMALSGGIEDDTLVEANVVIEVSPSVTSVR